MQKGIVIIIIIIIIAIIIIIGRVDTIVITIAPLRIRLFSVNVFNQSAKSNLVTVALHFATRKQTFSKGT